LGIFVSLFYHKYVDDIALAALRHKINEFEQHLISYPIIPPLKKEE